MRAPSAHGFSLIELLVVLAILALLASIGMPLAELAHRRAQEEELRRSLRDIRTALDGYKRLADAGRIARSAGASGYPPRLELLADGVADAQAPLGTKIFLLRRLPGDPFSNAGADGGIAETWGVRSYASTAKDPKPGDDVFDVYSKAPGVGLNGVPYRNW